MTVYWKLTVASVVFAACAVISLPVARAEEWTMQCMEPLWQSCDKGIAAVGEQLGALGERFDNAARNMSAEEFIRQVHQDTVFGQLAVIVFPHYIPEELEKRMFTSFFMNCWAKMYEIRVNAIADAPGRELREAFNAWEVCVGSAFRADQPAIVAPLNSCYRRAIAKYNADRAQPSPDKNTNKKSTKPR